MGKNNICPLCGEYSNQIRYIDVFKRYEGVCDTCGKFSISEYTLADVDRNKIASYLYYHSIFDESAQSFKTNFSIHRKQEKVKENETCLLYEQIENWYPTTFSEKINIFLLHLYEKTKYMGDKVYISPTQIESACFVIRFFNGNIDNRNNQVQYFLDYLKKQGDLTPDSIFTEYCLAPKGYQRIDELQKHFSNNKNVFVAMSFADEAKPIREAIRKGVIKAKYSPTIMDEIIHNEQIVPAMLRMIRESRLLILEITNPNYGAYYEAGYALGLGKEVIICCSSEVYRKEYTTEEEKKYERYLKPHFDVAQKQILVWDDYEDLTYKLSEWIKAIIG